MPRDMTIKCVRGKLKKEKVCVLEEEKERGEANIMTGDMSVKCEMVEEGACLNLTRNMCTPYVWGKKEWEFSNYINQWQK